MSLLARLLIASTALARLTTSTAVSGDNGSDPSPPAASQKPNFIFIMTDDQDLHLNSLDYMPSLREHFTEKGTTFENHYTTVSLCCPARVTLFTGRAAHNTNVTDIVPPYGECKRKNPCNCGLTIAQVDIHNSSGKDGTTTTSQCGSRLKATILIWPASS